MIVVKVGGSLYSLHNLRERLTKFLDTIDDDIVLVPGGGAAADAVRGWDEVHSLGDDAAHWLAVRSMDLAGDFLKLLISNSTRIQVLRIEVFLREHDTLPHTWHVTSDSIAAHVASLMNASNLILLKSRSLGHDAVDQYFSTAASQLRCPIRIVNLREEFASVATVWD